MDVLVAGGTGFLGRPLCAALVAEGHRVAVLSRTGTPVDGLEMVAWDPRRPAAGEAWARRVAQADAVINLAGENAGGHGFLPKRWNAGHKAKMRSSRLQATRAIVDALKQAPDRRTRTLLNASAIGFYGDRGDELLTESSGPGNDFFAELCKDWEAEAATAEQLGMRVVRLRTGVVLERKAMANDLLVLASKLGAGGPLGSGRQWWSWIHRDDVIGLMLHALRTESISGPLNLVAPTPQRMAEFPRVLGRLLHRPSLVPAPAFALRLVFGELADVVLLSSQRVSSVRAQESGYTFRYSELGQAFVAILRR